MATANWPHTDGNTYEFTIYDPDTTWNDVGGVYIFTMKTDATHWKALYIGKTNSFSARLPNHDQWAPAVRLGATHIHAAVISQEAIRLALEKGLIGKCQPPLNEHHK